MATIGLQRLGPLTGQDRARLWMAVPKRVAKRAVDRNLVKRVLREQWRLHRLSQSESGIPPFQYLAKLQSLPKLPRTQVKRTVADQAVVAFNQSLARYAKQR